VTYYSKSLHLPSPHVKGKKGINPFFLFFEKSIPARLGKLFDLRALYIAIAVIELAFMISAHFIIFY
jgi:hypothetical protein